jgi:hypothetical protein
MAQPRPSDLNETVLFVAKSPLSRQPAARFLAIQSNGLSSISVISKELCEWETFSQLFERTSRSVHLNSQSC